MRAGQIGKLVAKFIDKQWPEDRDEVFEILQLATNAAWREGRWFGMTAEFFVPVRTDEERPYIIAPSTHPILIACNAAGRPRAIRDVYFVFHRNGYGDVLDSPGCAWNRDFYDLGETPIMFDPCKKFRVGVRSLGPFGKDERVVISGSFQNNGVLSRVRGLEEKCASVKLSNDIETINGVRLDIKEGFQYVSDISFDKISSITKDVTQSRIEVCAIGENGEVSPIAILEPGQQRSSYRKYIVPDNICDRQCVHGLFKIAKQDRITSDTDELFIDNEEALISLCKGIYNLYFKEKLELGSTFILQGITSLEKNQREEESPSEFPIQVAGITTLDMPEILKTRY